MTSLGYTESTAASTLFSSYKNVSCILTPEVTEGPYYVTGEYIRTDVTEDQDGVPVHLEYQYVTWPHARRLQLTKIDTLMFPLATPQLVCILRPGKQMLPVSIRE